MLGAQAVARAFPEYSTTIVRVYPPAVHLRDYINVVQPEVLVVSKSPAAQKTFKVRCLLFYTLCFNRIRVFISIQCTGYAYCISCCFCIVFVYCAVTNLALWLQETNKVCLLTYLHFDLDFMDLYCIYSESAF